MQSIRVPILNGARGRTLTDTGNLPLTRQISVKRKNWQENPDEFTSRILVPFSWASPLSEITLPKLNIGWYSRSSTVGRDEGWKGKNVFLIFGASDFRTKVWINGQFAGEHKGGYVPFEFNISPLLKGGSNRLVVRVEDEELDNRPSGKQYYGNAKGIWQTVYLEPRNDVLSPRSFLHPILTSRR